VTETDFITAFARLLRDGKLRDAFAANPQAAARQVHLRAADLPAWLQLIPADVEFQAEVLLRKRLDLVKFFAPETCRQLGEKLWPTFRAFAREHWPPENAAKFSDASQFCERLKQQSPAAVTAAEWNRLRFAFSKRRLAFYAVRMPAARHRARRGLQFFLRGRGRPWREYFFYVSW
jgi:hypothetical protein